VNHGRFCGAAVHREQIEEKTHPQEAGANAEKVKNRTLETRKHAAPGGTGPENQWTKIVGCQARAGLKPGATFTP
jgi:hypothetical protein